MIAARSHLAGNHLAVRKAEDLSARNHLEDHATESRLAKNHLAAHAVGQIAQVLIHRARIVPMTADSANLAPAQTMADRRARLKEISQSLSDPTARARPAEVGGLPEVMAIAWETIAVVLRETIAAELPEIIATGLSQESAKNRRKTTPLRNDLAEFQFPIN